MKNKDKAKEQLIDELGELNQQISELEKSETEREGAGEALWETKLRYRTLYKNAPVGIGLATLDGQVIFGNKAMYNITGYSEEESRNINLKDTYNNQKERDLLLKSLKKEGFVRDFGVELKRKDGTPYYASLTINPFTLNGKKVLLTVCEDISERKREEEERRKYYDSHEKKVKEHICKFKFATEKFCHHITERQRAEEKLKQREQMLEASEKELKNFSRKILSIREEEKKNLSAKLHDEVGSVAVAFGSYLTTIEEETKNKNLKNVLEATAKSKSMLKKFVSRLKKIAADLRPPNLDIIDLPDALREYFSDVSEQANLKIDFRVNTDKKKLNDNVAIILYRIVHEATNNIIKHANATEVKITLYCRGNKLKLNVFDNGKGFDTKKNLKIAKIHMGLRGMREMVESLDGTLNIKSAPGKGTEISITLLTIRKDKS